MPNIKLPEGIEKIEIPEIRVPEISTPLDLEFVPISEEGPLKGLSETRQERERFLKKTDLEMKSMKITPELHNSIGMQYFDPNWQLRNLLETEVLHQDRVIQFLSLPSFAAGAGVGFGLSFFFEPQVIHLIGQY